MNTRFSERYGYIVREIQIESIDTRTRNRLWDNLKLWISLYGENYYKSDRTELLHYLSSEALLKDIFNIHFGYSDDSLPDSYEDLILYFKEYFINAKWHSCFDFIEAIFEFTFKYFDDDTSLAGIPARQIYDNYQLKINQILSEEKSTYRLINYIFTPISNSFELASINEALNATELYNSVNIHLIQGLKLFSNRQNPDYRNSCKESISALEALLRLIIGDDNIIMSSAIKKIKSDNKIGIHSAILDSLNSLYGWAGDTVRHANKGDIEINSDDAKFILVQCSSHINYLITKALMKQLL